MGEIGECPLAFLPSFSSFSLYSSTIQDFYLPPSSYFPGQDFIYIYIYIYLYVWGITHDRYKKERRGKIKQIVLLDLNSKIFNFHFSLPSLERGILLLLFRKTRNKFILLSNPLEIPSPFPSLRELKRLSPLNALLFPSPALNPANQSRRPINLKSPLMN